MILTLAAEDFAKCYGILILKEEDFLVEISHEEIPVNIMARLKKWYNEYYMFTGMSIKELEFHQEKIEILDKEGLDILNKIIKSDIFNDVKIYRYFSRGKDKILFEHKMI